MANSLAGRYSYHFFQTKKNAAAIAQNETKEEAKVFTFC